MRRVLRVAALGVLALLLLLLGLVGVLTLLRGASPAHVRAYEADGVPAAASREFARTAALLTHSPVLPNVDARILLDGDGTFPQLWRDLRGARRSLTLHLYYITPGAVLDTLSAILRARARAGVDVRLLYDDVGSDLPQPQLRALRSAGVHVAVFRPVSWYTLHKAQNRSHARVIVIDGRIGYTGGFGIDDRWAGPRAWRDTNVRFTGPAVAQLQASFVNAWAEATGGLLVGELFFPDSVVPGDVMRPPLAGVLHSYSTPGSTAAQRLFALTAAGARERLYITNAYFVPSDRVLAVLLEAAARGVDVRLLLPGALTDVPLTRLAARGSYERLLRGGVRVYEYQRTMIHAKTFVADGIWAAVGTINLDTRSFVHNDELNLLVWDPAFGAALEAIFLRDLEGARELRLDGFRQRGWWARIQERFAGLLTKVL